MEGFPWIAVIAMPCKMDACHFDGMLGLLFILGYTTWIADMFLLKYVLHLQYLTSKSWGGVTDQ